MVYNQEALHRNSRHNSNVARGLAKAVQQSLLADSRIQPEEAVTEIGECLEPSAGETDPRGVYNVLKCWYQHASAWAPNPFWIDMEKVRGDFQTLYQWRDPHTPGIPLATHVDPVKVNDATQLEAEVETAVCHLRPLKAGRHTHLRMEHFKQSLREAFPGENLNTPRGQST